MAKVNYKVPNRFFLGFFKAVCIKIAADTGTGFLAVGKLSA